jgi:hypothetical protein
MNLITHYIYKHIYNYVIVLIYITIFCSLFSIIGITSSIIFSYYFIRFFNIKYRRSGNLYEYNKSVSGILQKYGKYPITNVFLLRKPIHKFFDLFLDVLSRFNWTINNKEQLHHASMIIEIGLPNNMKKNILIEKNEGIIVSPYYHICDDHEMIHVTQYTCKKDKGKHKYGSKKQYTIQDLMKGARKRMGDPYFFNWDLHKNNCQYFILHLLKTMKLDTKENKKFIYQPLHSDFSSFSKYFINKLVDMKASIYKVF